MFSTIKQYLSQNNSDYAGGDQYASHHQNQWKQQRKQQMGNWSSDMTQGPQYDDGDGKRHFWSRKKYYSPQNNEYHPQYNGNQYRKQRSNKSLSSLFRGHANDYVDPHYMQHQQQLQYQNGYQKGYHNTLNDNNGHHKRQRHNSLPSSFNHHHTNAYQQQYPYQQQQQQYNQPHPGLAAATAAAAGFMPAVTNALSNFPQHSSPYNNHSSNGSHHQHQTNRYSYNPTTDYSRSIHQQQHQQYHQPYYRQQQIPYFGNHMLPPSTTTSRAYNNATLMAPTNSNYYGGRYM